LEGVQKEDVARAADDCAGHSRRDTALERCNHESISSTRIHPQRRRLLADRHWHTGGRRLDDHV